MSEHPKALIRWLLGEKLAPECRGILKGNQKVTS
jgi:hypothetical protein